jgi:hypothetical protein
MNRFLAVLSPITGRKRGMANHAIGWKVLGVYPAVLAKSTADAIRPTAFRP